MKIPFVKEWGSWAVFSCSVLAALIAGMLAYQGEGAGDYSAVTAMTVAGMALLINSKNPLASLLRARTGRAGHVLWFLLFSLSGLVLLVPFLIEGVQIFWICAVPVLSYAVLLYKGREHNLFTEYNGFALLTLSAPVVYFTVTGELSLKLYVAVLLFFGAGVFKVRVRTRKTLMYRWAMVFYCAAVLMLYRLLDISFIMLLPLLENVVSVMLMREERLKETGYTELIKGIVFIVLIGLVWK
jgi:hypothetical protein